MKDIEFFDNEMINQIKTKQRMFKMIYLTRGCGKELYRRKLLENIMKSIQEDVKCENNKIDVKWIKG